MRVLNPYRYVPAEQGTILFRASNTATNTGTSVTFTKPTGAVEGDLMIVFVVLSDDIAISPPSGWTEFATTPTTFSFNSRAYYKQAGASEPSTYVFTCGVSNLWAGSISAFYSPDGVGTWTLNDDSGHKEAFETVITTASVTGVDSCLLVVGYGNDDDEDVAIAPTDVTTIAEVKITSGVSSASYYELRDAGAVTKTIDWAGTDEELSAHAGIFTVFV